MTKTPSIQSDVIVNLNDDKQEVSGADLIYKSKQVSFPPFMTRALSTCIDMLILEIILSPLISYVNKYFLGKYILPLMPEGKSPTSPEDMAELLQSNPAAVDAMTCLFLDSLVFQFVVFGLYFVLCWRIFSVTAGGILLKFKVVDQKTLQKATLAQYFLRYVFYILYPLSLPWVLWSKRRCGIHDKVSGTIVIKT